ncbi:MAG: three-Cys-motif partner protein TcmP [Chitinophagales bacterium]|nr:three-Cys-motif partner protein TcmP [Chitinophagales bacterium]
MAVKSIFSEPFDEGTKSKLQLYKQYFEEWLPVFIAPQKVYWKNVQVFDFFAGEGCDITGYLGSPLIALSVINSLNQYIDKNGIDLKVLFNEKDPNSFEKLKRHVDEFETSGNYHVEKRCDEFKNVFDEYSESMKYSANFIFLDQNGIKEITEEVFKQLINLRKTDMLFYISSSYFKRFAETPEFKKYFPTLSNDIKQANYFDVHRKVLDFYKSLIPENKEYYLAPFSIKKGSNIYGLIFGSNHTLGIEKFLNVAWKNDTLRGEANFDIDNEKINEHAPTMFPHLNVPNKRQVFEKTLEDKIINGSLNTNRSVYLFTLTEGFLLKDANVILKRLKSSNKIEYRFKLISSNLHREEIHKIEIK